ncbi:MAG: right-handed parallel beta-helix repeat-containing protein [Candidatus Eisenbacteria bacterium]
MRFLVLILCVLFLGFSSTALAVTWLVPSQCPTIQAGIDTASAGDTVLVACGIYTWANQGTGTSSGLVRMKSGICLRSETGQPECVVIDAQGGPRVLSCNSASSATSIEGFTITGARGTAGIHGAGIRCDYSDLTIRDCIIEDNIAGGSGGGILLGNFSDATLLDCVINNNEAGKNGGGLQCIVSDPIITGCTFSNNRGFTSANISGSGGGANFEDSDSEISDCVFYGNTIIGSGGGLSCGGYSAGLVLVNSTVYGNSSTKLVGGVACSVPSRPVRVENVIIASSGAGVGLYVYPNPDVSIACCNVWGNAGGDWVGNVADFLGVNGNFSDCPAFCDTALADFNLCNESPCLPGNHPYGYDCGLIGAFGQGCICGPSATRASTWGGIKSIYR